MLCLTRVFSIANTDRAREDIVRILTLVLFKLRESKMDSLLFVIVYCRVVENVNRIEHNFKKFKNPGKNL